jgi:hypothetical protein
MFGNKWKLSNLSNTCQTTFPTDKESSYSEVRSGSRICFGEPKLLASSNCKVWVEHAARDRMLEHVLPIRFAEVVEREVRFEYTVGDFREPRLRTVKSGFAPSGAISVNADAVITSQRQILRSNVVDLSLSRRLDARLAIRLTCSANPDSTRPHLAKD